MPHLPRTKESGIEEAFAIAEQALDNIARLAEQNAEEPGWQVEVHRIACEAWRQVKAAREDRPE